MGEYVAPVSSEGGLLAFFGTLNTRDLPFEDREIERALAQPGLVFPVGRLFCGSLVFGFCHACA
jgi:hypothetical protein